MTQKFKEVIDWVLVLIFLVWGIWFLQEGHLFSTLLLWICALILIPYFSSVLRKQWDFKFYEQFKWPVIVVLLCLLILNTQIPVSPVEERVIIIEKEIFAPEVQQPSSVEEEPAETKKIVYVKIKEGGFDPDEIAVTPGTTIVWNNTWSVHVMHIYQIDGKYRNIAQSKKLAEGESFSQTFNEEGVYHYRDLYFGWKGKVHVS